MKKAVNFQPQTFKVTSKGVAKLLEITGQKLPPPSKRITLNQGSIKILNAKIIYKHKKGDMEFEISRINHLKTFGEVRLHTNSILYPGIYMITLEYTGQLDESLLGEKIN